MKLRKITIENFKGINKPISIELKPITLLFGANNAGKSSIIQALSYIREIFINKNFSPDITETGGNSIDFGGFENLVHNHDLETIISFGFEFHPTSFFSEESPESIEEFILFPKNQTNLQDIHEKLKHVLEKFKDISIKVSLCWSKIKQKAHIAFYEIKINKSVFFHLYNLEDQEDHLRMMIFDHPFIPEEIASKIYEAYREDSYLEEAEEEHHEMYADHNNSFSYDDYYDKQNEKITIQNEIFNISGHTFSAFEINQIDILKTNPLLLSDGGLQITGHHCNIDFKPWEKNFLYGLISSVAKIALISLQKGVEPFYYIGPLRKIPLRNNTPRTKTKRSRWASGLAAYDIINDADDNFLNTINYWLSDRNGFDTGYKVIRNKYKLLDIKSELMDNLINRNIWTDEYNNTIVKKLLSLPEKSEIFLVKKMNNIRLFLQDVGTGISQILPIIVGTLKLKAKNTTAILAIEQPELHIHPAIQAKMGDLFINQNLSVKDQSTENDKFVSIIIETHSEHLMLRILRRIRETTYNKENNFQLVKEDVAVYHIGTNLRTGSTRVNEITITDEGEFSKPWPNGFFPERAKELFS